MRTNRLYILACVVWLTVIVTGLCALAKYAQTPGVSSLSLQQWPAGSELNRPTDRDSLVMFVHPMCPCSSASMEELNRLMTKCTKNLAVTVLFVRPPGMVEGWEKSNLWREASAIPGVTVRTDTDGTEAKLFDASTSGQAFLFARDGTVLFKGGITESRGHAGDNAGVDAISLLVNGLPSTVTYTPVFGCQLGSLDQSRKATCNR